MSIHVKNCLERPGPKKILSIDGGGIRGIIALRIIERIEDLLRKELGGRPDFVLAEYFDFIAGTSTGAIIATLLSMGFSVHQLLDFYQICGESMFEKASLLERFHSKYTDESFSKKLHEVLGADTTLGSEKLKTLLMLVMRNANTDQAWAVTNNPNCEFNRSTQHSQLHLPLWKLVRASSAAPAFFPPETIEIGDNKFVFIDGCISSYNNPAFFAFLKATTAPFAINWPTGEENILLVSVGTGVIPHENRELKRSDMNLLHDATDLTPSMILSATLEQDMLCRIFGNCLYGPNLNNEVDTLIGVPAPGGKNLFTYVRYNEELTAAGFKRLVLPDIDPIAIRPMDTVAHIDKLSRIGTAIANQQVKPEHFAGFV